MIWISCALFYKGFEYDLLETINSGDKRESQREEREPAKIELRGCWDFILGQLQKTIRL